MADCIFCKIVNKEIPTKILHESEDVAAFPDNSPSADIHILIVPKKHISKVADLTEDHGSLLTEIFAVANNLVKEYNLQDDAYRITVNGGKAQHVPHLHFHLLGGKFTKQV